MACDLERGGKSTPKEVEKGGTMAVFKCKMCGGTIGFNSGDTVGVCDYCGSKQTLPRLDDDRRANLYDRANHFRRNNEFDKAAGLYEQILNEDMTDAEAYWSLVLCRYGIEYVEDPTTHKRVPTVNRTQFTSIFDDEDYKSALQHADMCQRTIYEKEAATINEIQKGILAISQKESPFDVFICYKETDPAGRRTQDSVLANELYHQLTNEGFKVFFSRITLEDKIGTAYEPYIFAALNSSKVMVVLGTKPEYFNAVWVKNEWSRYLSLVKLSGGKKILIPAYRDMDPYDLPEEFSHLQAQDMSKLGFMQDLIRGIKKIASNSAPKVTEREPIAAGNVNSIDPLLKRAFMFLEDGEWSRADDFCERVLNQDPENAQAYLGKLMVEFHVSRQEELKSCAKPFNDSKNYQKAVRFGDSKLEGELSGYIDYINNRNENIRLTNIYNNAISAMKSANSEEAFRKAAEAFKTIPRFKDADELVKLCLEKAEVHRNDDFYARARSKMNSADIGSYEQAIKLFQTIPGWRDVDQQIIVCQKKIEEIRTDRERQAEERRTTARKRKKAITIVTSIIVVGIIFVIVLIKVIIPKQQLDKAKKQLDEARKLVDSGNYEEAYILLNDVDYKDSKELQERIKPLLSHRTLLMKSEVGSCVFFGTYEQDNNASNGKEDIEWIILEKEDDHIFVVSRYALDCQPYNTNDENVTWETCSLRKWMNGEFLNTAFSEDERTKIKSVPVSADKNPEYDTIPGNRTTDQIFLLSIAEVNKFFSSDEARQCLGTPYCYAQGAFDENGKCFWFLRSPGRNSSWVALVDFYGTVKNFGTFVKHDGGAVRPAMWIDLGS